MQYQTKLMKKFCLLAGVATLLVLASCQKEMSVESVNNGNTPGAGGNNDYQPVSAGSEWEYSSLILGDYTIKSLGSDSMINGIRYYMFDNIHSLGISLVYINKDNGIYRQATRTVFGGQWAEVISLKDAAVGTTWTNTITSQGINSYHKYTVAARDIQHTVNGKTYSPVIELDYEYLIDDLMGGGSTPVSIGSGKTFVAKGVGSIESYYTADMFGLPLVDSVYLISSVIR